MAGELRCYDSLEDLSDVAAEEFTRAAAAAIAARGSFRVALSGGSTPRRLYEMLADEPYGGRVDWSAVDFFWGDERPVPPDHEDSNYRMAHAALLGPIAARPDRVHRIEAERSDRIAVARDYQAEIARVFGVSVAGPPPAFDLVLLGLGTDGHTASLFPASAALRETALWVVAHRVAALGVDRVTLTLPILNHARRVAFLVAGPGKAKALAAVRQGAPGAPLLPARLIDPVHGTLLWLVDRDAAARLSS